MLTSHLIGCIVYCERGDSEIINVESWEPPFETFMTAHMAYRGMLYLTSPYAEHFDYFMDDTRDRWGI